MPNAAVSNPFYSFLIQLVDFLRTDMDQLSCRPNSNQAERYPLYYGQYNTTIVDGTHKEVGPSLEYKVDSELQPVVKKHASFKQYISQVQKNTSIGKGAPVYTQELIQEMINTLL